MYKEKNGPKVNYFMYEEVNISRSSSAERTKQSHGWPHTKEKIQSSAKRVMLNKVCFKIMLIKSGVMFKY